MRAESTAEIHCLILFSRCMWQICSCDYNVEIVIQKTTRALSLTVRFWFDSIMALACYCGTFCHCSVTLSSSLGSLSSYSCKAGWWWYPIVKHFQQVSNSAIFHRYSSSFLVIFESTCTKTETSLVLSNVSALSSCSV